MDRPVNRINSGDTTIKQGEQLLRQVAMRLAKQELNKHTTDSDAIIRIKEF